VLVVCALALVVAAAFFLVVGLAGGDVGDLYLSMVLCVASLVVVAVSARLSRIRPAPAAAEPPTPVDPEGAAEAEARSEGGSTPAPERAREAELVDDPAAGLADRLAKVAPAAGAESPVAGDDGSIWASGRPQPAPAAEVEAPPAVAEPEPEVEPEPQVEPERQPVASGAPFPIADYDDLAVAQILPLVPELWPEEVPVVAERERATKARPAVLDALAGAGRDPSLAFPIAEYENLDTEQITRLLNQLDEADLATVQAAERSGPARVGVLVAVANQLAARK
jgi:hypothetical protein